MTSLKQSKKQHTMQTRKDVSTHYDEFKQIFEESQIAWRSNKTHMGNGYFIYKTPPAPIAAKSITR